MRILIVEDIVLNRILLCAFLEELSNTYKMAENGKEALDILKVDSDFDIILMDIEMPVMNGFEALRAIKALDNKSSEIPIIALTAHNGNKILDYGFDGFLAKPFSENDLEQILDKNVKI